MAVNVQLAMLFNSLALHLINERPQNLQRFYIHVESPVPLHRIFFVLLNHGSFQSAFDWKRQHHTFVVLFLGIAVSHLQLIRSKI